MALEIHFLPFYEKFDFFELRFYSHISLLTNEINLIFLFYERNTTCACGDKYSLEFYFELLKLLKSVFDYD